MNWTLYLLRVHCVMIEKDCVLPALYYTSTIQKHCRILNFICLGSRIMRKKYKCELIVVGTVKDVAAVITAKPSSLKSIDEKYKK